MHPSTPTAHTSQLGDMVVMTGLTASPSAVATPADAASAALSQIDRELELAGVTWEHLRVLTVQIEAGLPGVASWRFMAERP